MPWACSGPGWGQEGKSDAFGGVVRAVFDGIQHFGAKINSEPDEADEPDEPDEADEAEMVAATAGQSPPSTRAGGQDDGS